MNQTIERKARPGEMKYMKRAGIYSSANVSFNPETKTALSYNWWEFVKVIGGKVVFNSYRYSATTQKHQSKVKDLLSLLGIGIDFDVEAPQGLQNPLGAIEHMENRIKALEAEMQKGRPNTYAQQNRQESIAYFEQGVVNLKEALNNQPEDLAQTILTCRSKALT
jgi:hypothetical protein